MIAISTGIGLQQKIREKLSGFTGHIQVTNFDSNRSFETLPINKKQLSEGLLHTIKGIKHSQVFITKSGIIKTKKNIFSMAIKICSLVL